MDYNWKNWSRKLRLIKSYKKLGMCLRMNQRRKSFMKSLALIVVGCRQWVLKLSLEQIHQLKHQGWYKWITSYREHKVGTLGVPHNTHLVQERIHQCSNLKICFSKLSKRQASLTSLTAWVDSKQWKRKIQRLKVALIYSMSTLRKAEKVSLLMSPLLHQKAESNFLLKEKHLASTFSSTLWNTNKKMSKKNRTNFT